MPFTSGVTEEEGWFASLTFILSLGEANKPLPKKVYQTGREVFDYITFFYFLTPADLAPSAAV